LFEKAPFDGLCKQKKYFLIGFFFRFFCFELLFVALLDFFPYPRGQKKSAGNCNSPAGVV